MTTARSAQRTPLVEPLADLRKQSAEIPRVLLIDDDAGVRESVSRVLKTLQIRVLTANGGKQALEAISEKRPDLIITDLCMAPLTGWDILLHLREHRPDVPVFVITGLPRQSTAGASEAATQFFQKPLDLEALLEAVQRYTGMTRAVR